MSASQQTPDNVYLQVRNVTKTFGHFVALADISLDMYRGEFICFLGPSGCGKTTLLRIIAGLEEQNTGQIIQNGVDISRFPPARRDFGIVFQSYALFPNLTAAKNIAYGLEQSKLSRQDIQERVQQLLNLVGLPDSGHKYPAQLSGGQQQRIALARALALSPGLLLLDEPLSALDAKVRASLRTEMTSLHQRLGITSIMVTHDQAEALTMADRVVVMDHGRIVQVGTSQEIYHHPATPFVANFVGVMNFMQATVTDQAGTVYWGSLPLALNHHVAQWPAGSSLTLAIRPEDVRVADAAAGAPSVALAHIEQTEFLGPTYRLHLRIPANGNGHHDVSLLADIPAQQAHHAALQAARMVPIQLPSEAIRVFAPEA
ncbi:MAG: putative 2-aminoethylphosphonate ABC transporter ATP-binding protein [Chloroflexaceae bacterium]|nr:putative 2-aminoethylphosphonate ABC transporter ATP-binding protein [Chloroflexaceae bacterium]